MPQLRPRSYNISWWTAPSTGKHPAVDRLTLSCSQRVGKLIYTRETGSGLSCFVSASGKWLKSSLSLWPAFAHSPFVRAPGCAPCGTEMPRTVRLEPLPTARDAGGVLGLMQTPGFSWQVLSELFSSGMKLCARGASSADSHLRHRWQGTAPRAADRRLLWSRDPWGSFRG